MKLAASATGKKLSSQIDPRFGRSAYFVIVETNDMSFEAFENDNVSMNTGAGISSANFIVSKGAKALLTGNCGPKAMQVFSAAGIEVFTGQTGTIKESVEKYTKGLLQSSSNATVPEKAGLAGAGASSGGGMGQGMNRQGRGMGMGGGRGMGGGCGRGMGGGCRGGGGGRGMGGGGRGMNSGTGMPAFNQTDMNYPSTKKDELAVLKEQSENLKKQMQDIEARIKNLK